MRIAGLLRAAVVALCMAAGHAAFASDYPNKPIKLIVTVAAGGPIDTIARLLADEMSGPLGQTVIVENRAGAGGTTGARSVVTSDPDGYTLMLSTLQTFGIAPALYPEAAIDAAKFTPVGLAIEFPFVFVVPAQVPANSPREFVTYARERKGSLSFGGSLATPAHLLGILFTKSNDLDIAFVPYKGLAPSISDLVSARTHMAFDAMTTLLPLIREGKLRALGVLSEKRSVLLPDVPTMSESGFSGFPGNPWTGIVAPPGTPKAIVERVNQALNAALKSPKSVQLMEKLGLSPIGGSADAFAKRISEDQPRWMTLVKDAGVKPE